MPKVLVLRANVQTLTDVLDKANALNQKSGPFDCAIILGKVLESTESVERPGLPVFFTNGDGMLVEKQGSESLGHNLTLLNGYGMFQNSSGLRIGYLTGNKNFIMDNEEQIKSYFKSAEIKDLDILITDGWSKALFLNDNDQSRADTLEDEIVKISKPKYHFATLAKSKFHEATPFKWADSETITRCLNIAEYNSGARWAYAFSVDSTLSDNQALPKVLANNPYEAKPFSKRTFEAEEPKSHTLTKRPKQILPEECRFCLSNPAVQDHLIIHISEHAYLTIAKGPLTMPTSQMDFSGHCLLIPIKHIPKLKTAEVSQGDVFDSTLYQELEKYENSIVAMNHQQFQMSTVVFEINSQNSVHYHIQIMPIPAYLIPKFDSALERQVHFNNTKYSNNAKLKFDTFQGTSDDSFRAKLNDPSLNYIKFAVHENSTACPKIYMATFNSGERIDLQFGRRVLAFVLKLPKRAKWDSPACTQTLEQEKHDVQAFQAHFKSFEPST
ncbi:LAME_0E06898g1_1 [Lachancea meyersii CBS 8951]|uniref:LAME_0E06898g1_1 n=1 Tax=Lachancea meyersii CBS 8951 TaxID=1266667 RepID=A0A1G4JI16_9SACH|nr:LAME_0E06898g1_1 [Lachancea meyersii CBS 8951]